MDRSEYFKQLIDLSTIIWNYHQYRVDQSDSQIYGFDAISSSEPISDFINIFGHAVWDSINEFQQESGDKYAFAKNMWGELDQNHAEQKIAEDQESLEELMMSGFASGIATMTYTVIGAKKVSGHTNPQLLSLHGARTLEEHETYTRSALGDQRKIANPFFSYANSVKSLRELQQKLSHFGYLKPEQMRSLGRGCPAALPASIDAINYMKQELGYVNPDRVVILGMVSEIEKRVHQDLFPYVDSLSDGQKKTLDPHQKDLLSGIKPVGPLSGLLDA